MFVTYPPAPQLASIVQSYWFIEDIPGEYEGLPIRTSPVPAAILSVNLGRPNETDDGSLIPDVSLLGLQSHARSWRSFSNTYFVMAMLTIPGLIRLFPHTGSGCSNQLVDLGAIAGDTAVSSLLRGVTAALEPARIAKQLDCWLIARLSSSKSVPESRRLAAAHQVLRCGGPVAKAAAAADVDRRQLHRWFDRHLGIAPKELGDLERLHKSLQSVQTKQGDSASGYSDQAHQIRNWRARLGITPGAYDASLRPPLAADFSLRAANAEAAFYL